MKLRSWTITRSPSGVSSSVRAKAAVRTVPLFSGSTLKAGVAAAPPVGVGGHLKDAGQVDE